MSQTQQTTVFGDAIDKQVHIQTEGRAIRPFKNMVGAVAGEYRLHADSGGLYVTSVNPSNTIMVDITMYREAFDSFEAEESTFGIRGKSFGSALRHARYGVSTNDEVSITIGDESLETETKRTVGKANATVNERVKLIDPASIRAEPDIPALDLPVQVEIEPDTLIEAYRLMDGNNKVLKLGSNGNGLVLRQDDDINQRNVELECDVTEASEFTYYSTGMLGDLINGLHNGYVDTVTLKWGEDFPLKLGFEREGYYSGEYMIAPRIKSE